jgi:ABC-type transporter MlaC component
MPRLPHTFIYAVLLSLVICTGATHAQTPQQEAHNFIADIGAEIMDLLTSGQSGPSVENKLAGVFHRALDFKAMSRLAVGRHWQRSTPAQRKTYQALYADYVTQIYVARLLKGTVEGVDIQTAQKLGEGEFIVTAAINRADQQPLKLGFRIRRNGDVPFKVVDVTTENVSLVMAQRNDFSALLDRNDFDALIAALQKKISANKNKAI